MTLIADPRFQRREPITEKEAADILRIINQEEPSKQHIQTFLAEYPDYKAAISKKLLPALDESRRQTVADNRPLGDQITDLVNRNR